MADMPARAAGLRLENLGRRFQRPDGASLDVLGDVSLTIAPGSFTALVGASGCGKSTLLRHVAGLDAPSRGRVVWDQPLGPGDVGMVFQDATLMPWATIQDNVRLPLDIAGIARRDATARVDEALSRVGLAEVAGAHPKALSGGMRMRASIARALVTRPRVLLMDEPFAALDEITRQKLNDDLLALWRALGFTALFVTHSVAEGVYLAQRVLVMAARPGRVVADIPLPQERQRTAASRAEPAFAAQCGLVSQALAAAMAPSAPDDVKGGAHV